MIEFPPCPVCKSPYTYAFENILVCPECGHEWEAEATSSDGTAIVGDRVLDANGVELANGDSVVVVKDLPVKGAFRAVKSGTKVKNIKLRPDSDHNIDCKIDGFGAMALKSEYVRKVV